MILEVAVLNVRDNLTTEFEATFSEASSLIARTPGYVSHELRRCLETPSRYLLLVTWETLEAHTVGFRGGPHYAAWRALLHHFYEPFPTVEHYESVLSYP